jgi:signal transduction histidine kinase
LLYSLLGASTVLQLGQSLETDVRFSEAARRILLLALLPLLAVSVVLGLFMARKALGGVADVTRTARRIAEGQLASRVVARRRFEEIEQLAATFNRMLDRIQALVDGMREMSDNIAHDLKSPVARIRGLAEVSLATEAPRDELAGAMGSVVEECDRLLELINTMLLISRTEAGVTPLAMELLDLAALLREACALFEVAAEDRGLTLTCELGEPLPLRGDRRLLQRLVANLLDNALGYTPAGGSVTAAATRSGAQLVLTVADTGPGIAAHDLPHIFERFYRGDPSRTVAGAGLGLSLARAVCQAHGGTIEVDSTPGRGACFTVRLPTADAT